ncbi:MFS transporter, partial [Cellulomonas bogoriensis 69B4 = DSM 16987]
MSATSSYRDVWALPGAPRLLGGGVVARLGQGITVLAWLLLIRETTGSYAQAATVTAASSVAIALAAPVAGRLADRFGPSTVLVVCAIAHGLTQVMLLAAVLARAPLAVLCALAFTSGAVLPPIGPALRAAWAVLTGAASGRSRTRNAAMSIESALFELVYVLGPLLFAGFMLLAGPLAPLTGTGPGVLGPAASLLAAATCTVLGTVAIARGSTLRGLRTQGTGPRTRGLGPLRVPGIPRLLVVTAGIAVSFGAAPVALAAWAEGQDPTTSGAVTGVLVSVWSLGSAAAGLWFATQHPRASLRRQLLLLTSGLAAGYGTWLLAPSAWWLGVVLVVTGAVIAPLLTVQANIVAHLSPQGMLTEAYTWMTTTNLSAAALGAALTGVVVDTTGSAAWGFVATGLAAAVAALV